MDKDSINSARQSAYIKMGYKGDNITRAVPL